MTSDEQNEISAVDPNRASLRKAADSALVTRHSSLYLASSNPGKLREFSGAAALRKVTVLPLPGFAKLPVCIEDGTTFEENARKKAIQYSEGFPGLVFADDSGICVDALGGAPGIYSARFAGPQATDEQNNQRLLADLHAVESQISAEEKDDPLSRKLLNRAAHYICSIALARLGEVLTVAEGRVDGVIIDEPRGSGGFGYDPYFFYPPLGKTLAEVHAEEKFAISHRGTAFRKLLNYLCARR